MCIRDRNTRIQVEHPVTEMVTGVDLIAEQLSLIHISEPTRRYAISYAVFCLKKKMGNAAIAAAKSISYEGAGTVEFLVDDDDNFYFMEMNTRIQVEHPVTEMVTGVDLIAEQIKIASGANLEFNQDDIHLNGHAIECRINAEDPSHNFRPSPGKITGWLPPGGPGVRVDSHVYTGYEIPPFYDSLIGKLIVWGKDRNTAIKRMNRALNESAVTGIPTTINFHLTLLDKSKFKEGKIHTKYVEEELLPNY